MTTAAEDFRRGLFSPSLSSLVGAVLAAAAIAAAGVLLATPSRVAALGTTRAWDDDPDTMLSFTIRCLALRHDPPPPRSVVLIGASDLKTLVSSEADLVRAVESCTGVRPRVTSLAIVGVSEWHAIAALDHLPDGFEGVVVLAVSPERLTGGAWRIRRAYRNHEFGLDSPRVDAEARRAGVEVPDRTGAYLLDHFRFFRARGARILFAGRTPPPPREHFTPELWEPESRQRKEKRLRDRLDRYEEEAPDALARLGRTLERVRARTRARILFVEMPRRPGWAGEFYGAELLARHRERLAAFARQHDAVYHEIAREVRLESRDFADDCHLVEGPASRRLTVALAQRVGELLDDREEPR